MLEIATHPLLVPHLPQSLLDVLQQALDAHRYALNLDQDNPDTLFNTAQVLTAIAEAVAKDSDHVEQDALQPLEEALELQNRCLSIQELKLEEYLQQVSEAATSGELDVQHDQDAHTANNADSDGNEDRSANAMEDQWFSVVEPVTKDTLIDTILAQLGTLTTLCSVISSSDNAPTSSLAWIEEYSSKLIKTKLPVLVQDADQERLQEVALARANFISELLRAGYLRKSVDADTYKRERDEAFKAPELDLERNFAALMANASSLVAYTSALAEDHPSQGVSHAAARWNALSAAISNMAIASKLSDPLPDDIAETHFVRGNCSLTQHQLGQPPVSYNPAVANKIQLLKNADTFFRNASKLYQDAEQKAVAQIRAVVTQAIQAGTDVASSALQHDQGKGTDWVRSQLEDLIDDGLISPLP